MKQIIRLQVMCLLSIPALVGAYAQSQVSGEPLQCPVVRVSCWDSNSLSPLTFSANISGLNPSVKPTFQWVTSAGKITGGQGTPSVTVDTSEFPGGSVTATVEVSGLPDRCPEVASCTTTVIREPLPQKIGEYGAVSPTGEKAYLGRLLSELQKDPHAQGYILSYAGRRARAGEAMWRAERARQYLIRKGRFDPRRVVAIDGGYKEARAVELYVVPSGVTPPPASPTVDPDEVKIIGRSRKRPVRP